MSIETEKKYRLDPEQRGEVVAALEEMGAKFVGRDFEENVVYSSSMLREKGAAVRLRHIGERSILTFKRRAPDGSGVKRQIEHETEVKDPDAVRAILDEFEVEPALVYEKFRDTWNFRSVEVVLDELPFGGFMEIEGSLTAIKEAELLLGIEHLEVVEETYPGLTSRFGKRNGTVIEARFSETEG